MARRRAVTLFGAAVLLSAACGLDVVGSLSTQDLGTSDAGSDSSARADTSTSPGLSDADFDADFDADADAYDDADAAIPDAALPDATIGVDAADASTGDASDAGSPTALSFDGTDDLVRVLRQVQDDFTLEAWIRTTTSRGGSNFYDGLPVIYADVSGSANDFGTSILSGKFAFGTVDLTIASTTTVTTGAWVHVAAVRIRSSGTMRVLVNGAQETQTTSGSTAQLNDPPDIDLGGNKVDSRFFNGSMDEVRIWSVARTAAQIQGAMKTRLVGNEAGLVGYWRFDDASGTVAVDSSGSGNDGALGAGTASARPTWIAPGAF